jgi:hypothetical protein
MSRRRIPAAPAGPEPEQEQPPTSPDAFQVVAQAASVVWQTIPQIPGGVLEMGDMAADMLHIPDWEAGG